MRKLLITLLALPFALSVYSQVTIKMKREGGVSIVPCKVNGLNLKFIFDTGASDVSISMTEASFMLKNDYLSPDDILGKSNYLDANGNITEGVNIILREIEIGGLKLYNVKASVVTNLKAPLLLGQSAISKLGVIQLDLEANTLTILTRKDSTGLTVNSKSITEPVDTTIAEKDFKSKHELLLDKAFNYFTEANYQQSVSVCDDIISEDPQNEKAYFLRGISHHYLEDYKSAIKDYGNAIQLKPNDHLYYCYRGKSKIALEDYPGALADLNKGLTLDPKDITAYKWRADVKEKMKNITGAILDYDKAISLDQLDSSLYVSRAYLKREIKDYKGAIVDCNKAISMSPDYAEAYYCRGLSKKNLSDISGSMDDFNQAIELDQEIPAAYAYRGLIKEEQYEDYEGAMEDYEKALELNSEYLFALILKSSLEDKIKKNVWIKVGETKDGDRWYIYNSVASKEYSTIKLWVKNEYKTLSVKKNGKSVTYSNGKTLTLCLFHCVDKEYKILVVKNYDSKGNLINEYEFGEYEDWKTPAPQTVIEMVLKESCERYN